MRGLRVGVVEAFLAGADPGVASCVRSFAEALGRTCGASFTEIELPGWEDAVDACSRLILEEALALYGEALSSSRPGLLEEGT